MENVKNPRRLFALGRGRLLSANQPASDAAPYTSQLSIRTASFYDAKKPAAARKPQRSGLLSYVSGIRASIELPLYFIDVISDSLTTILLWRGGQRAWALAMLGIIMTSWMSGFAVTLAYAHYRFRISVPVLLAAFVAGLPGGVLLALYLDLAMPIFAAFRQQLFARAERLGTSVLTQEFATFMASYRVVRQVVEVTTESLPQVLLQLYIYRSLGAEDALSLSSRALVVSCAISSVNLCLTWIPISWAIRHKYGGQALAFFRSHLSGGARIPIAEFELDRAEAVSLSFGPHGPADGEVLILRQLLSRNSAAQTFLVQGVALPLRELLAAAHVRLGAAQPLDLEQTTLIGRLLAHNPAARTLTLERDAPELEHGGGERGAAASATLRRGSVERGPAAVGAQPRWHDSLSSHPPPAADTAAVIDVRELLAAPHAQLRGERWTSTQLQLVTALLIERAARLRDGATVTFDGMRVPLRELRTQRVVELSSDLGGGRRLGTHHAALLVNLVRRQLRARALSLDGERLDVSAFLRAPTLDLASRNLRDPHALLLGEAIALNRGLETLSLWGNHLADITTLVGALEECPRFRHLDVSWNALGAASLSALALLALNSESLERLVLFGAGVTSSACKRLARALERSPSLRVLILFSNNLGDIGAAHIAQGLRKSATLEELGLAHNAIGEEGGRALALALAANADELRKAQPQPSQRSRLFARVGGAAETGAGSVTRLSLGGNRLGDESALAFASALAKDPQLEELQLADNVIGNKGARALADALASNTRLRTLDLRGNRALTAEGKAALQAAWPPRASEDLHLDDDATGS